MSCLGTPSFKEPCSSVRYAVTVGLGAQIPQVNPLNNLTDARQQGGAKVKPAKPPEQACTEQPGAWKPVYRKNLHLPGFHCDGPKATLLRVFYPQGARQKHKLKAPPRWTESENAGSRA